MDPGEQPVDLTATVAFQMPSPGRIVHYRLDAGPAKGQYRPAVVVRAYPDSGDRALADLTVFVLPSDYAPQEDADASTFRAAVPFGDADAQWTWPPR